MSSALDGVPHHLPALVRAEKLGERARAVGMDWKDLRAVLAKVREEVDETLAALDAGENDAVIAEELGDCLLALANAPRFVGWSVEETLAPVLREVHPPVQKGRATRSRVASRTVTDESGRNRRAMGRGEVRRRP